MPIANGSRTQMAYIVEATMGVTPTTPAMKELRCLGRDLNLKKGILVSQEIRSDRQIKDVRHGYRRVEGNLPFELGHEYMDDMIEGAFSGTWAAATQVVSVA